MRPLKKISSKIVLLSNEAFTAKYTALLDKEQRLYADEEVAQLPQLKPDHPHYKEWLTTNQSSEKLLAAIGRSKSKTDILDIGCGNGWLTAKMAGITSGTVTGIDINEKEIEQAKRVFGEIKNCHFLKVDIQENGLGEQKFDLIVFAASIQYFKSLQEILNVALKHLKRHGKIHIINTRFYEYKAVAPAQEASKEYYLSAGFPELANHYHHHCIYNLKIFQYEVLYDPSTWMNKLFGNKNPFHWVVVKHRYR